MERRANTHASDLRAAYLRGLRRLFDLVPEAELARRVRDGSDVFTDAEIRQAFAGYRLAVRDGVERAGEVNLRDMVRR